MRPLKRNDSTAPLLLLLLLLISLYSIKPFLQCQGRVALPCRQRVYVQVLGDVERPGVHAFCGEPSPGELMTSAGVRAYGKDPPLLHPSGPIPSGTSVQVKVSGTRAELTRAEMNGFYKLTLGIPLSINRESAVGLTALPGIGPGLARAIVEERTRRGGFRDLDELTSVRGISKAIILKMRPYVRLS